MFYMSLKTSIVICLGSVPSCQRGVDVLCTMSLKFTMLRLYYVYIVYLAATMMQMSCVQCPEVYYTVIVLCPERVYWAANMLHISCALCPKSILECHCT